MPVPGPAAHTSTGPRPPFADRLTRAQWLAIDAATAVVVALWVVPPVPPVTLVPPVPAPYDVDASPTS